MDNTVLVLVIVIVLLVLGLIACASMLRAARRSAQLRERHGPEYERTLRQTGDRQAAEEELADREKRYSALDVRDLEPDERERFATSWAAIQRGFVDDPAQAVRQADGLIVDILRTRGFPEQDAERRTDDLAVEHPRIVEDYRRARATRAATDSGDAGTEQQRAAVTSYRRLVDALLEGSGRKPEATGTPAAHKPAAHTEPPADNGSAAPSGDELPDETRRQRRDEPQAQTTNRTAAHRKEAAP